VLTLGIDTSNYTTSTALYDSLTGEITQRKQLLPVKDGAVGQRQSDAVFGHVKQLGVLLEELLAGASEPISAVGVSVSPRDEAGSYMPCFLAGEMAARSIAAVAGVPLRRFSHQSGHVAAALFGAGRADLFGRDFLAFHVSGGTTQCLLVQPGANTFAIITVSESLDLHAGQAVDRVGHMLGLAFPSGPALEALAEKSPEDYRPKPAMKGLNCCLSGLENRCADLLARGEPPENVAKYCLCYLRETLLAMTEQALALHPGLPLVYAGGVMSNRFLQAALSARFKANFAPPAYSADNAAGVAILTAIIEETTPC
jgi:N6-L-threonylcarbamoyladenine synthase